MLKLAFKLLGYDKQKTLFTVLALAAVISVILILEGFEQGQYTQLEQVVLNRNADLIAAQSGVENFIATRSVIPQLSRIDVEAVEGVKQAHPITALPIIYKKDKKKLLFISKIWTIISTSYTYSIIYPNSPQLLIAPMVLLMHLLQKYLFLLHPCRSGMTTHRLLTSGLIRQPNEFAN